MTDFSIQPIEKRKKMAGESISGHDYNPEGTRFMVKQS